MKMERLTEWTGEEWIARQKRLNGKIIGNKTCLAKLAAYEDTGLTPEEVQELVEKKKRRGKEMTDNAEKLNYLIAKYDFPLCVLQDIHMSIHMRIEDCMASYTNKEAIEQYIGQQVKYLENLLKMYGIEVDYKN